MTMIDVDGLAEMRAASIAFESLLTIIPCGSTSVME